MSSQNNNETNGFAVAFAFIGVAIAMAAAIIAVIACFITFVFTILALLAWNRPLKLGKHILTPAEARGFVYRGLAGAVLVPAFAIFCVVFFNVFIPGDALPYLIVGGYVAGSLGIEVLMADGTEAQAPMNVTPPPPEMPRGLPAPPASRQPFEYARWDDEDARR
jgi:hypothetical protein